MTTVGDAVPFLRTVGDAELASCLDVHMEELLVDPRWPAVEDWALAHMFENGNLPLGVLLPNTSSDPGSLLPTHLLSPRTRHILQWQSIVAWPDLRALSPNELLDFRAAGRTTVSEILRLALRFADGRRDSRQAADTDGESGGGGGDPSLDFLGVDGGEWARQAHAELKTLASWAIRERRLTSLSELFRVPKWLDPPTAVAESWKRLNISLTELADPELVDPSLEEICERLFAEIPENRRQVLENRLVADAPMTLGEVGALRGMSRQAAAQEEDKLKQQLSSLLDQPRYLPVRWRAADLHEGLGVAAPQAAASTGRAIDNALRDVSGTRREPILNLMLRLVGPRRYSLTNGWYVHDSSNGIPTAADFWRDFQPSMAVDIAACREWLNAQRIDERFLHEWAKTVGGLRVENDLILRWDGSVVDKCVSILEANHAPATIDELVDRVAEGHNLRSVRTRLFQDPRIVRVDKCRVGLKTWGFEEYTGIADEIAQRIREGGGEADLEELISEIVDTFGVAAGSVRAYADAPMFVRSGKRIRLRRSDEGYLPKDDLAACKGVYRLASGAFSYTLAVDADVLRGSGRPFPEALAAALEVTPGNRRTYGSDNTEVQITWPTTSFLGPSLGSVRSIAERLGSTIGDRMLLVFDPSCATVTCTLVDEGRVAVGSAAVRIECLTGVKANDRDVRSALARAVGVEVGALERTLRNRSDNALADLLPPEETDPGLASALEELATLIESKE